jgi:hypothetical protein
MVPRGRRFGLNERRVDDMSFITAGDSVINQEYIVRVRLFTPRASRVIAVEITLITGEKVDLYDEAAATFKQTFGSIVSDLMAINERLEWD